MTVREIGPGDCAKSRNDEAANKANPANRMQLNGISFAGAEPAHANLAAETDAAGFDFDTISGAANRQWEQLLSKIELEGGTHDDQSKLYTSLYRAYAGKALLDDRDGSYRDACGDIQHLKSTSQHLYSSDALWGAQWTLAPLWDLLTPEASSFNRALLVGAMQRGWLPDTTVNMRYAHIMDAQHEIAMIVGAWQKGVREKRSSLLEAGCD